MQTTIQQWGNSLALRIPKAFAQQTKIKRGSPVSLTVEKGRGILKPLKSAKRREYTLEELVSKITPANRPEEVNWGRPQGKEIW